MKIIQTNDNTSTGVDSIKSSIMMQKKRKKFENPINLKPEIEDLDLIEIDKSRLTVEQKDMIEILYTMY